MVNWIYTSETRKPNEGEIVLCDLGKERPFMLMRYDSGTFEDTQTGKRYSANFDVRRWLEIGKHYNE